VIRFRPTAAFAVAAALIGCSSTFAPYATIASNPQPGDAGPRVAICYNTMHTPLATVHDQAQRECPTNTVAEPADTDFYMQVCPLLLPLRASFICTPTK